MNDYSLILRPFDPLTGGFACNVGIDSLSVPQEYRPSIIEIPENNAVIGGFTHNIVLDPMQPVMVPEFLRLLLAIDEADELYVEGDADPEELIENTNFEGHAARYFSEVNSIENIFFLEDESRFPEIGEQYGVPRFVHAVYDTVYGRSYYDSIGVKSQDTSLMNFYPENSLGYAAVRMLLDKIQLDDLALIFTRYFAKVRDYEMIHPHVRASLGNGKKKVYLIGSSHEEDLARIIREEEISKPLPWHPYLELHHPDMVEKIKETESKIMKFHDELVKRCN